jgi:hypothetical protein
MAERRRQRAREALAEARRLIDEGELRGAAERLERARSDFAAELDLDGVRDVRAEAERGYQLAAEADDPFYEQLLYASAQNVRFLSRRDAARRGVEWVDPHPELDLPGRPEIRAERGIGRKAKAWIVGVSIAAALAVAGITIGLVVSHETGYVVNDTSRSVGYVRCGDSVGSAKQLAPGEKTKLGGWGLCIELTSSTGVLSRCLHIRDGETARVSDARAC